jgi:protein-disulfide isomerase
MTISKRSAMKKRRANKQKKDRQTLILVVGAVVFVLAAIIIGVNIVQANQPVGEMNTITPIDRPSPDGTAMGNPDAPVRIDVFEDFQCSACKMFTENVEIQVMNELVSTGKVYYVFRHYPFLDDRMPTKESDQAANASMCAAEQGRFWDYHDMLYANTGEFSGAFSDRRLQAYAQELSLDMNAFNACYRANRYQSQIDQDIRDGLRLGVSGTPSVYVNGKAVRPGFVPSFDDIRAEVEAILAASGN